ncbi:MAG TPA: hypothetical protein DDY70_06960 [Clostridiales bacterium]|mgnify:CR=1 FL=1|nr:hypothetical protein [Clostridiales bacterium]
MKIEDTVITSRQNPKVCYAASLAEKKGREGAHAFLAEGEKLTLDALAAGLLVTHIFAMASRRERLEEKIFPAATGERYRDTQWIWLSDEAFSKISTEKAPQGVVSVIKYLDFFRKMDIIYKEDFFIATGERAIALHEVRDPSNLGAVIRSAAAFGIDTVVLSSDCADIYSPKTVRAAMGSLFRVKVVSVGDFASFVRAARGVGRRVLSAELSASALPLDRAGLSGADIVVIGNEGHGVPREISALCDAGLYIPITEKAESLNASVAASVILWEQRKGTK